MRTKNHRAEARIPRLYSSQKNCEDFADLFSAVRQLGIDDRDFMRLMDEIEDLPVHLWIHDQNHRIVYGNSYLLEKVGNCMMRPCYRHFMGEKQVCGCCPATNSSGGVRAEQCTICKRNGFGYDISISHTSITNKAGEAFVIKSSYHLDDAAGTLAGHFQATGNAAGKKTRYMVLCSACNRMKNDDNNWVSADPRASDCSNVRTSHGICPQCIRRLYPGLGGGTGIIRRAKE